MHYTDIVKARALRRAGRACEMCGTSVGFDSAQFVSANPIFGVLFDQDDCCVLCQECLQELDPATRDAAERDHHGSVTELDPRSGAASQIRGDTGEEEAEAATSAAARPELHEAPRGPALPDGSRETWLPRRDPDGGLCA